MVGASLGLKSEVSGLKQLFGKRSRRRGVEGNPAPELSRKDEGSELGPAFREGGSENRSTGEVFAR